MTTRAEYRLVTSGGEALKTYVLSDSDIEWLARSLWGEEGDYMTREAAGAVAWTMFNRFMRWRGDPWGSFAYLIQAFSQPVNPVWLDPNSSRCQAHPDACTPEKLERRRRISFGTVPFTPRAFAEMFAAGTLSNPLPSNVVDFAACGVGNLENPIRLSTCGECFYRDVDTGMSWTRGTVVRAGDVTMLFPKIFGLAIGVGLGFLGLKWAKKWLRRRSHKR